LGSKIRYESHVVGRDVTIWYQDYFSLKKDSSKAPATIIKKEIGKFEESYNEIAKEQELYKKMDDLVVGPGMLIAGILLGVLGVIGVVYYIKRSTKATDK
jgi:hypothetical protein